MAEEIVKALAIFVCLPAAALFLKLAWLLWTMPYWLKLELDERRAKRQRDQEFIRIMRGRK